MKGYTSREVAQVLGIDVRHVRRMARSGALEPARGARNEYRFSFQDMVLLRAAAGLLAARLPARRVLRALRSLRAQLPHGPLSGLRITADGDRVVVHDDAGAWHPESGQFLLDFRVDELAGRAAPIARLRAQERGGRDAQLWYELGAELESVSRAEARRAYERAIEIEPAHADALVNLGRLLHEEGRAGEAVELYRKAISASGRHATAAFNLGVALEDLGRTAQAADAYRAAIAADETFADAHFNLSRLCERTGDRRGALRHLRSYRSLTGGSRNAH